MIDTRRLIALVFLGGVFVMEGFDIAAMSIAVPRLEEALGIPAADFGWVLTAILVGLGAGGALVAPLGDKFGRRALIVSGCFATGLATLGTSTSDTISEFLIWRLLTGFALGACLPNVSALSSEIAPPKMRATIMAVVSAGIPIGLSIAGILTPFLIGIAGWQGLFYTPGIFAVLLSVILWFVLDGGKPARGAEEDGEAEASAGAQGGSQTGFWAWLSAKLPQLILFRRPWVFPFMVFAVVLGLNALNLYLLNSWLPTILPGAGLTLDHAAQVAGVANLAGLAIGIGASLLLDRWHKGLTLIILFGSMAVSFAAIAMTAPDPTRWTMLLMVGVGGANAGGMVLPGLAAYLFPARLLSSAVGMGVLVARLGAFAGPPLGAAMIAADVPAQVFLGVAAIPALACVIVSLLVPMALEIRGRQEVGELQPTSA